jgi:hypothetical protein
VARIITALVLFCLVLATACGATEDPGAEPPRLVVAYVDEAGDVRVRGEPGRGAWRFPVDGDVLGLSWSPVADRLLIVERLGEDWQLWMIASGSFTEVARVPLPKRPMNVPVWRADGAAFVLSSGDAFTAFSRTGRELWSLPQSGLPLGWSPDGEWFAFTTSGLPGQGELVVTDGSAIHQLSSAELDDDASVGPMRYPWLADWTMIFGEFSNADLSAWEVTVSRDGVQLGRSIDPWDALDLQLAMAGRDELAAEARQALAEDVGVPVELRHDLGGSDWTSIRYDDAEGHHRTFSTRDGARLGEHRITIGFGSDPFPQIAVATRREDD